MENTYLTHHGILGMKWGVRRTDAQLGHDTSSRITNIKKKSKRQLNLEDKYQKKGISEQDAEAAAKKRAKIEKIIKITAGVTVAAAVATYGYLIYKAVDRDNQIAENMKTIFDTAKNNGIMKISDLPKINFEHNLSDDVKAVNKRYSEKVAIVDGKPKPNVWQTNCGYCATALELRRRGFDVEAVSNGNGMTALTLDSLFKGVKTEKMDPEIAFYQIRQAGREWGEGARGTVHVGWKGGSGHAFSFEIKDGKPIFVDPQTNNMDASLYFGLAKNVRVFRLDNLDLKDNILNAVKKGGL